jgi:hypothetical protein
MSYSRFRQLLLAFALFLGFQALWILVPETIRPGVVQLPLDSQVAALAKLRRSKTLWAASLGFVRGDLWADGALTYADLIWTDPDDNARAKLEQEARTSAERALAYSPHRADVWLLLAALSYRFKWNQSQLASALKMSYYTGSNEISLVPLRLFVSVGSQVLDDTELQEMVRRDIRMIVTRNLDLKPMLTAAYKLAPSANKKFIESAVAESDSHFVMELVNSPTNPATR